MVTGIESVWRGLQEPVLGRAESLKQTCCGRRSRSRKAGSRMHLQSWKRRRPKEQLGGGKVPSHLLSSSRHLVDVRDACEGMRGAVLANPSVQITFCDHAVAANHAWPCTKSAVGTCTHLAHLRQLYGVGPAPADETCPVSLADKEQLSW